MNKIEICPSCGCKYRVPEEFKGQKIVCKQCGTNLSLTLADESKQNDEARASDSLQEEIEEISQDDSYLLIGKLAVKYKFASLEQINQALAQKERKKQAGQDLLLGEILVSQGIISQTQMDFLHSLQMLIMTRESDNQFAIIAVKNDFVAQEAIDHALLEQKRLFEESQSVKSIEDILVEYGVLKAEQRDAILQRQKQLGKGAVSEKNKTKGPDTNDQMELNRKFDLSFSKDRLSAFIVSRKKVAESLTVSNIKEFLANKGVKYGIVNDALIKEYLDNENGHRESFKIATGEPAKPGKSAQIKYYFETDPLKIGTLDEDAVFDFKDRENIGPVKKGDLIAERIPAEVGEPGMDVYGRPIPAPEPNNKNFRLGKGATVSEDGLEIFAGIDGVPRVSVQGKVSVLSQLEISGDVGLKAGHVDFEGDIHVAGGIQNGYRVKGHSLLADEILKSEVEMAGDIVVAGGIIGSTINSGGNIRAIYVREAAIKAFGDVVVEKEIIDANIETCGACIIKGGTILSSTVTAKKGIWADQIGSDVSKPCTLVVGVDVSVSNEVDKLMALIPVKQAELDKLESIKQKLRQKSKDAENKVGELAQLQDRTMVVQRKIQSKIEELQKANDHAKLAKAETALQKMDTEIKAMEDNMEKLFDLQDRISEKIEKSDLRVKAAEIEIQEHEDTIREITEWASNGDAIPEVRVNENIFRDTTIDGTNSSLALKQRFTNVLIKEHGSQGSKETLKYQIKIEPLK